MVTSESIKAPAEVTFVVSAVNLASLVVTLVLNEALAAVNEPEIPVAVRVFTVAISDNSESISAPAAVTFVVSVTSAPSSTFISPLNSAYVLPLTLLLPINRTSLVVNASSDFKAFPLNLPKVKVACFPSILLCKAELETFN